MTAPYRMIDGYVVWHVTDDDTGAVVMYDVHPYGVDATDPTVDPLATVRTLAEARAVIREDVAWRRLERALDTMTTTNREDNR